MMIYIYTLVIIGFLLIGNTLSCLNSLQESTCIFGGLTVETRGNSTQTLSDQNCNQIYDREDFLVRPDVKFPKAVPHNIYTLVMTDPDGVNLKRGTYVLHWMVANIRGIDFKYGFLNDSLIIKRYHPPTPPLNSGTHRYQFSVYSQDKKLFGNIAHENRGNFLLETWLESTAQSLCGPIAGMQFRVEALTADVV